MELTGRTHWGQILCVDANKFDKIGVYGSSAFPRGLRSFRSLRKNTMQTHPEYEQTHNSKGRLAFK